MFFFLLLFRLTPLFQSTFLMILVQHKSGWKQAGVAHFHQQTKKGYTVSQYTHDRHQLFIKTFSDWRKRKQINFSFSLFKVLVSRHCRVHVGNCGPTIMAAPHLTSRNVPHHIILAEDTQLVFQHQSWKTDH